ncbi:MAG: ATP-binding protein [Pseudomonadota bacterium]
MVLGWLKTLAPRSLFGRTALILLVPILTIQIVVSYVFIQRLYERVTEQMTRSVLPSLSLVLAEAETANDIDTVEREVRDLARDLGINLTFAGAEQIRDLRSSLDLSGAVVSRTLRSALPAIRAVDLESNSRRVRLSVDTRHGLVSIGFPRERVSASNPHQLLVLMVFVAFVVTVISFLFLRNQVRPIRHLAEAASAFGRGQHLVYRPSGAMEVRQAGSAFLEMRTRIERHIEQRTLLLSGVSHDLRTPLTRMKLSLSLMPDDTERRALERDVHEMQEMLTTFLDFASVDATETVEAVEPAQLVAKLVARGRVEGAKIELGPVAATGPLDIRPMALERALQNLINNAKRHGTRIRISVAMTERTARFSVEDDGPGIPEHRREEAMKPFARLDASRNQDKGGGVGLGLSIVRDVARQHGGMLRLGESADLGGLQVDLLLAR